MASFFRQPEETVRLEGFSESLRGHRAAVVASNPKAAQQFLQGRLAALDAEVAHRGRKILVVQGHHAIPKWILTMPGASWDTIFHVKDTQDLKLALTVIQHAPKPLRVAWMGGEPQAAVLQALQRVEATTLLSILERAPVADAWQAIFWTPEVPPEEVEPAVVARYGSTAIRPILKELNVSDVGLVWSSIGESERRGGLYWFDPNEGVLAAPLNHQEAAETLRAVADLLSSKPYT